VEITKDEELFEFVRQEFLKYVNNSKKKKEIESYYALYLMWSFTSVILINDMGIEKWNQMIKDGIPEWEKLISHEASQWH